MTRFPQIDSPCPLRWEKAPTPGNDFCTQCQRRVHNLDAMNQAQRQAFISGCDSKVCVSYTVTRKVRRVAAVVIAAAAATSAAPVMASCDPPVDQSLSEMITVGGVNDPREAQWIDADADDLPELPVIDANASPGTSNEAPSVTALQDSNAR